MQDCLGRDWRRVVDCAADASNMKYGATRCLACRLGDVENEL